MAPEAIDRETASNAPEAKQTLEIKEGQRGEGTVSFVRIGVATPFTFIKVAGIEKPVFYNGINSNKGVRLVEGMEVVFKFGTQDSAGWHANDVQIVSYS